MKCPECGYDNINDTLKCNMCGARMPQNKPEKPKDERSIIEKLKDFKNSPRNTPKTAALISVVVGLFTPIFATGHIYLGYYNRFIIEAIISALIYRIMIQTTTNTIILQLLYLIWFIYTTYDTYKCAQAKKEHKPLPK